MQLPMLLSLTYFKYIFFVTKLSFFPKFCLPRKPSLLLEEHGPNKTKRDEQELNHQRGNGVGKFMATPKREREAFDFCGISDVTRTERGIYYTLLSVEKFALFTVCGVWNWPVFYVSKFC